MTGNSNGKPITTTWRDLKGEYRCTCSRLLFQAALMPGSVVEIRCPKCGRMNAIESPKVDTGPLPVVSLQPN